MNYTFNALCSEIIAVSTHGLEIVYCVFLFRGKVLIYLCIMKGYATMNR